LQYIIGDFCISYLASHAVAHALSNTAAVEIDRDDRMKYLVFSAISSSYFSMPKISSMSSTVS
jgi:hypothetical protein